MHKDSTYIEHTDRYVLIQQVALHCLQCIGKLPYPLGVPYNITKNFYNYKIYFTKLNFCSFSLINLSFQKFLIFEKNVFQIVYLWMIRFSPSTWSTILLLVPILARILIPPSLFHLHKVNISWHFPSNKFLYHRIKFPPPNF